MKKILVFILMLGLLPAVVFAADFKGNGETVTVEKNENPTNLYVVGQTLDIEGDINKDLVAAGNTLNIMGDVESSVIAAGSAVNLSGEVGNNARLAGQTITISNNVDGDVNAAGSNIIVDKDSTINGDFLAVGGKMTVDGKIEGDIYFSGRELIINGSVGGDIKTSVRNLTIGDSAVVGGKVSYRSENQLTGSTANIKGGVEYTKHTPVSFDFNYKEFLYWSILMKSLLVLVALFVLVYLMPRFSHNFANESYRNIWKNLGYGALTLFVTPIIMFLLFISLLGIPLAIGLGMFYLLLLILAGIYSPLVIGSLVYKVADKKADKYVADWKTVLIGIGVVFVLQLIPVVGWLALFFFFLVSLGEFTLTGWGLVKKQRNHK